MAIFKCKMCGGTIEFEQGATVGTCEYCGTKQTLPKTNDDVTANLFNRANNLRLKCEFDKAEQIYEKIVQQDDSEAEAHWGIVLCKYGIEYVEDPKTTERIPTCHRTLFDAVTADPDYLAAVDYSDASQQVLYEAEARKIDRIQKDILEIVKNEKPFDVFLCYKESDDNGKRTVDSAIANDIYYQLTQEGFKVFYAAITLEDKLGTEYEPYIFAALNSAKVMLVIGTKPEYFNAVWVKNEWSRYLKLMKTDRSRLLIPCYRDMDAYDLPEEFAHLQAQDMSKIGFINDITRGIKKVLGKTAPKAEVKPAHSEAGSSTAPLLKRAFMALEDGEWEKADNFCEQVLNQDPENAQAYLGKLMAELHVKKQDDLKYCETPFDASNNYQKAVKFGDAVLAQNLKDCIKGINERNENTKLERECKAAQKRKKALPIIAAVIVVAIVVVVLTAKVFIPNSKYNAAVALMNDGKYDEAITAFETMNGYKDSTEQITACQTTLKDIDYNAAVALMNDGKYDDAISAFEAMDGYKDSADQIALCLTASKELDYNTAVALMDDGEYDEAIAAFEELGDYKDSAIMIAKIYEKPIFSLRNAEIGDHVTFGAYKQAKHAKEDIEWIVLAKENKKILVISKDALDCKQYNSSDKDITWEQCSLRSWLNSTFLNSTFSSDEQEMIATTRVNADDNPQYNTSPGNATNDKVFLLSVAEAEKYFASNLARQCSATTYAKEHGSCTVVQAGDKVLEENNCFWWLRSPGNSQHYAAYVDYNGDFGYKGRNIYTSTCGIRPAMWINLG